MAKSLKTLRRQEFPAVWSYYPRLETYELYAAGGGYATESVMVHCGPPAIVLDDRPEYIGSRRT
jgi:hypothetical protein